MPKPPPRSSSGSSTPCSSRICGEQPDHPVGGDLEAGGVEDLRADVRVQADQLAAPARASTRRTASAASPPASEKPNFWSSWAVAMNSWVCASTPTVTRTSTRCGRRRARAASAASRAISSNESTTIRPTPASSAAASSATDLLLPCSAIRSAGNPARSATASSPPVQTSRPSPSSSTQRTTARAEERLAGVVDVGAAERRREVAAAARGSRPRRGRRPGCRARPTRSRTSTPAQRQRAVVGRGSRRAARPPGRARSRSAGGPPRRRPRGRSSPCRGPAGWARIASTSAPAR